MRKAFFLALALCLLPACAQTYGTGYAGMTLGNYGNLNGFRPFPADNPWNTVVTNAAVDPSTSSWHSEMGGYLHPDLGVYDGGSGGIPYQVIDSSQTPLVKTVCVEYCDGASDYVAAPIPANPLIEGGIPACDVLNSHGDIYPDRHGIYADRATGFVFEYYQLVPSCAGGYAYSSSALWDMTVNEKRPFGWTSVDAAGLSVFAGLAKWDEAYVNPVMQPLNGTSVPTLGHAIRLVLDHAKCGNLGYGYEALFVAPATHSAQSCGTSYALMGMRVRLQASFNCGQFTSTGSKVMCYTMQTYGMIFADNGSRGYFIGTSDPRWSDADENELKTVSLANFDILSLPPIQSASQLQTGGTAPTVSTPVASPTAVYAGGCSTITWTSSGASYEFLQNGPPSRTQSATVCPVGSTTYTVQSSNFYGRTASAAVQVRVKTPVIQGGRATGAAFSKH